MTAIGEGLSPVRAPAETSARREFALPGLPHRIGTDGDRPNFRGLGDESHHPVFRELHEQRGREIAEAVQIRQADRRLGRVAAKATSVAQDLEHYKIYPPYPVDEPRREAVIRQFNGVAADIERLLGKPPTEKPGLPRLAPNASTADADRAIAGLKDIVVQIATRRSELAGGTAGQGVGELDAETTSADLKAGFANQEGVSITGRDAAVLRQIA